MVAEASTAVVVGTPGLIDMAIDRIRKAQPAYNRYHAYYCGVQPLTYSSEKYDQAFAKMVSHFAENMCPAVIDSLGDRLKVTGFSLEDSNDKTLPTIALDLWRRNRMDERAGQVHTEALKEGDAYLIVWPDVDDPSLIRFWPQDANGMTVYYNEDTLKIDWAAKYWIDDVSELGRLTLYFPDRIDRYVTIQPPRTAGTVKASSFREFAPSQLNPYGQVPVFHFANNSKIGMWGKSDLADVLPLQDALNKAVCDMLVSMEFAAFRQRWATGIEVRKDELGNPIQPWKPGVDRLWTTTNEDAQFGQFEATDLNQYIAAQSRFKEAIADVSGIPQHYLQMSTVQRYPSGEALKTAEARFISKIIDRQTSFGNVWEDAMKFALIILRQADASTALNCDWQDAAPRSDMESAQTGVLKKQLGVPQTQIWREMGYSEDDIARMTTEKQAEDEASMQRQMQLFQRGGNQPPFMNGNRPPVGNNA